MNKKREKGLKLEFFTPQRERNISLPLYEQRVPAGFPSPAEDYLDKKLDLNEHLIDHPAATFFVRVSGHSMVNAGIYDGDLLIVDRSLEATDKKIIIGVINGEFTVKRIRKKSGQLWLLPENEQFEPVKITEEMDFRIWGVVTYAIHKVK
jgi:DNA polymerase V